jgi:hypothetical protein
MHTENIKKDKEEDALTHLTRSFFDSFTNKNNKQADLTAVRTLFIKEALIIKKAGLTEVIYDLTTFIEPRKKILSDGTLTDFKEEEISAETRVSGNIAQRSSRYQKSGCLNGVFFKECGHKFFQFIRANDGWKISAIVWEDDPLS